MPDRTKIVFPDGHELLVDEEPSQVMDRLTRSEPFHQFKKTDGVDIHIPASSRIAYIEQVPEEPEQQVLHAPEFGATPGRSPHTID